MDFWNFRHLILGIEPLRSICRAFNKPKSIKLTHEMVSNNSEIAVSLLKVQLHFIFFVTLAMANGTTGTFYMLDKDLPSEFKILLWPW